VFNNTVTSWFRDSEETIWTPISLESYGYSSSESTLIYWQEHAGQHSAMVENWGFWSRILREQVCNIANPETSLIEKLVFWSQKMVKSI
jgi:hypothetical protein